MNPGRTASPPAAGSATPGLSVAGVDVLPMAPVAGALAAVQAAAASLAVVLVPVVLTWVASGGGSASWVEVVQVGTAFWLLAQHTGLTVAGGHLGLVPLGTAVVPLLACVYAGVRLSRGLDPKADKIAAGASRALPSPAPRSALIAMALTHGALGVLAATLSVTDLARPILWQAALGTTVVAVLGGTLGSLGYAHGGTMRAGLSALADTLPDLARRYLAPIGATLAVQLLAGLLAVVAALVLGAGRVAALYGALGGGVFGAVMVTLLQVMLVPNLAIWAAAALAGPGFAVGVGTEVSPLTSTLGPLPAVPALGALPDPGPMPAYAVAVVACGVLAGAVGALALWREGELDRRSPLLDGLQDLLLLALGSGVGLGVLAWLSGGPAGPGRMSQVGPTPWLVAGVFAIEVVIGAAVTLVIGQVAPRLVGGLAGALPGRRGGYRRDS